MNVHSYNCGRVNNGRPRSPSAVRVALSGASNGANLGKIAARVGVPDSIAAVSGWWEGLNDAQKSCAAAHEVAHTEGIRCEQCADIRAGAILRHWGFPRDEIAATFRSIVSTRRTAGPDALKGFDL